MIAKRKWMIGGSIGIVFLIIIVTISVVTAKKPYLYSYTGSYALTLVPFIDGHNDLPYRLRKLVKNNLSEYEFKKNLTEDPVWGMSDESKCAKGCHTDLPRLRRGMVSAQFWVAYVDCKLMQYKDAVASTLEQIDVIKRFVGMYPYDLVLAKTSQDIWDAFYAHKIASLIGVEGGHSIDSRLGVLRMYYDLGVRYMTLTHTCNTPWAEAATKESEFNLTAWGQKVIREMNRIGMMVDLSHVSFEVMRMALLTSKAPVIFSHSSVYTINNHPRNVPDDILDLVKENNGIIMINFYPDFVNSEGIANLTSVVEHIDYVASRIGFNHVGIGADYDGVEKTPEGLEDVSKYPKIFDYLYERNPSNWTLSNLKKLAGENFLRVFKDVERVRDVMYRIEPEQEWIPDEDLWTANSVTGGLVEQCRGEKLNEVDMNYN